MRSGSSLEHFFNTLLPDLEKNVEGQEEDCFTREPGIELFADNEVRDVAIRQSSPIRAQKQQVSSKRENMPTIRRKDPLMEELEVIKSEFDKRSRYGEKLADIMIKGLKKTLEGDIYNIFLANRLPSNWYPIIRMNNDNTPYVEFIIKSDVADQDPDSQFSDYTMSHIIVSQIILRDLRDRERRKSNSGRSSSDQKVGGGNILPPDQKKIRQYPERMACSTPRKTVKSIPQPSEVDLNDSKRVLPHRACKSNTTITYTNSISTKRPERK